MSTMITAGDLLQIVGEIHQYSVLLLELREGVTYGISRNREEKPSCFKIESRLGRIDREKLVEKISAGGIPENAQPLPVDQFIQEIEGKKTRHIWLETCDTQRKELGFLSISELKAFFRSNSRR